MAFGANQAQKNVTNTSNGVTQSLIGNSGTAMNAGTGLLNVGGANTNSGTNFFNTLLNGNSANTTAALQPNISQIQQGTQQALQQANTLMPRGGGRAGTNYAASFAPQAQITNLFNGTRSGAAQNLDQTGLQQSGLGTNLFQIGNSALTGAGGINSQTAQNLLQQQQMQNQLFGGVGSGLFGIGSSLVNSPYTWGSLFGL